jgi:hypothetical protein
METASEYTLVFSSYCPKYRFGDSRKISFLHFDNENHICTTAALGCTQIMTIPVKKRNFWRNLNTAVVNRRFIMKNIL